MSDLFGQRVPPTDSLYIHTCKQWRILDNDSADVVSGVDQDREQGPGKATQDEDGEGDDKEEEVLVVAPSDAVVHPGTVVIEVLWCVCVCV